MSVRPVEALECGANFSLRDCVSRDAAHCDSDDTAVGLQWSRQQQPRPSNLAPFLPGISSVGGSHAPAPGVPTGRAGFRFAPLAPVGRDASTPTAMAAVAADKSATVSRVASVLGTGFRLSHGGAAKNDVGASVGSLSSRTPTTLASSKHAHAEAEVLRLSAYVDDLHGRLSKSQATRDLFETRLAQATDALAVEKARMSKCVGSLQSELDAVRANERRLKAEITAATSRGAPRESTTFMASVTNAINVEETLKAEVSTLQAQCKKLQDEVGGLTGALKEARDSIEMHKDTTVQMAAETATMRAQLEQQLVHAEQEQQRPAPLDCGTHATAEPQNVTPATDLDMPTPAIDVSAGGTGTATAVDLTLDATRLRSEIEALNMQHADLMNAVQVAEQRLAQISVCCEERDERVSTGCDLLT